MIWGSVDTAPSWEYCNVVGVSDAKGVHKLEGVTRAGLEGVVGSGCWTQGVVNHIGAEGLHIVHYIDCLL